MSDIDKPVFHDPKGHRARGVNLALAALAFVAAIVAVGVGAGLTYAPTLPPMQLDAARRPLNSDAPLDADLPTVDGLVASRARHVPASAAAATRFAFLASSDPSSLIALRRHAARIDAVIADWITLAQQGGISQTDTKAETKAKLWTRRHAAHIAIYPQLDNGVQPSQVAAILATGADRQRAIDAIAAYLDTNGYAGLVVNLTDLPPSSRASLATFLRQLRDKLRPYGRRVILSLDVADATNGAQALVDASDYVLLQTYAAPARKRPEPIAAQGWFESQLATPFVALNRAKLIVSIGSFGYDWDALGRKREIAVQRAWDAMRASGATLGFASPALNAHFNFTDNGLQHDVWFLDAATAFNQAKSALALRPAGLAMWRLGLEDPGIWDVLGRGTLPDRQALASLREAQPGSDVYSRPVGDFLDFRAPPSNGERAISYNDALGLIVRQSFSKLPQQPEVPTPTIADKKLLALTFDDGPDPRFTPAILDILAQKGAKATFFIVGKNAVAHPELLKRILAEGHDIGNHTYSHADLLNDSDASVEVELNGTQRVLESILGRHTMFFRPPYASRHLLHEPGAPHVVERAAKLGYLTVSAAVDPFDWSSPTSAQISKRIIDQVKDETGQVILLHDSGGNRKPTVDALPAVIDVLQAEGYEFAPLHRLLGKTPDEVMPQVETVDAAGSAAQGLRSLWYAILQLGYAAVPVVIIGATALGALRLSLIVVGAHIQNRRELRRNDTVWRPRSVAVLVPAYNEEKVICSTVRSLLASSSDLPLDIIVVDDGSKDATADIVRRTFAGNHRVKVFEKPNGGKAAALNFALRCTTAEVVVAIDADTVLDPDAIGYLVRHFGDEAIGAVAGSAMVGNKINLLTRFQAIEYATSQNLDRRAFELFNAISVVPGAIGAWRRDALLQVGGYASDTLAEDADVTIALERHGWKVIYEPRALAHTEAPETLRAFLKQRFRWLFGTLQVAHKNAGPILRSGPLPLALITLPNIYLFQFAFALIAPLMDALLLWTVADVAAGAFETGRAQDVDSLRPLLMYWAFFQLLDIAAAVAALRMDMGKSWSLLPLIVVQRFCYRQLLYVVALRSLLAAVKGRFVGWGKLVRTGSVQPSPAA